MRLFHPLPPNGYLCKFLTCGKTYDSLSNFRGHLKKYHQGGGDIVQPPQQVQNPVNNYQMNVDNDVDMNDGVDNVDNEFDQPPELQDAQEEVTPDSVLRCISKSALTFVSKLYSIDNVNRAHVEVIVKLSSQFIHSVVSSIRSKFQEFDDPDIEEIFDITSNSFEGLLTESQRFTALKSCGYLIESIPIPIDYAQDVVNNPEPDLAQLPLTGQFVPFREVLKQFFEMPNVFEKTLTNYENLLADENNISNIVQGSLWKDHIAPKFEGKTVLPLDVNYDDFEPDNLAGSHQGDHKVGGTYFNCPVIPQQFLGSLKNMFVAQLILSDDRNVVDGNHKAFHLLLKELKFLEEEGLVLTINNQCRRVYFTLALVLGDNAGLHSVLGFVEGFTANYPCRMCRMHKDLVKRMLFVPEYLLRTPENYANDVATNDQQLTGVYEECVFNEVGSYHVALNQSVDIQHDVLEGVAKYSMCKILENLIYTRGYFSLETLILRVNDFSYGVLESGNRPPSHKLTQDRIMNDTLNFSSAEMLCFIRFFGMMVGDLVPQGDPVWEFYLILREIVDIIFAPSFSPGTPEYLKLCVEIHHQMYLNLFHVHLKPKHHYMLHYHIIMRLIGPLVHVSSMRWESKHRELKIIARSTCSRKNLPKTLITKYLLKLGFRFLSGCALQMDYDLGVSVSVPKALVDPESIIDQFVNLHPVPINFECLSWVRLNGTYFSNGLALHVGFTKDYPSFCVIDRIVYLGLSENFEPNIVFVCHKLVTSSFNRHLYSYEVNETNDWHAVAYDDLSTSFPLSTRVLPQGGLYVCPRCWL
ncbi:uncharacterized protein LOC117642457 [Thrips palmi]|uniref:Uncharacterized protein LOC117642457 n=1 Tax=Thrips palmi TaxID=161013 RepID=A0A6P8YR88_THRPL|nr:uncharacterized protein LOC117642457 [Thrips palmi]